MEIHIPTIDTSNTDKLFTNALLLPIHARMQTQSGLCAIIMIIIDEYYYYYFVCLKFPVVYVMCTWN